jgi:hypothetical protein
VTFNAMISSFEAELDRTATAHTPPPGLHRLNRTEYANVVRDLLNLDVDASKYLPSDDSTAGFDNIAGALGISSTLVEAYVSAAQKISRLAMGYPAEASLAVYRTREDASQDYHIEGLPFWCEGFTTTPSKPTANTTDGHADFRDDVTGRIWIGAMRADRHPPRRRTVAAHGLAGRGAHSGDQLRRWPPAGRGAGGSVGA